VFKNYVDVQIEQLINQSEDLAKKYLHERDDLLAKKKKNMKSKRELIRMIGFLDKMQAIPEHLRQNVEELRGMSDEALKEQKRKYEELLELYSDEEE
jgi:acyl-CoA reductase-like NAD-dependent aldehyde dehydrogenase